MKKTEPIVNQLITVDLSLSALLSQMLVAFTIEFDNEFERRMPHQTAADRLKINLQKRPWLISMVMWYNCLRFITEQPMPVNKLEEFTLTPTNLDGMRRWGYVFIETAASDKRLKPPKSALFIRATPAGIKAKSIFELLTAIVESRWQERFGSENIDKLSGLLQALVRQFNIELPDCMPVLGYGLYSKSFEYREKKVEQPLNQPVALPVLLSKVLLLFAIDFEKESKLSLAISANILRVLDEQGVPLRNLPVLSGVSKEAVSMAMGILQKHQLVVVEMDASTSRSKMVRLTINGVKAQYSYRKLIRTIEENWKARFGKELIDNLRNALINLVPTEQTSLLYDGIQPYPNGWRASIKKPVTLPHFPMVLHRGGYPDGS